MERELRSRGEQEARLQQISRWISDQSRWMDSAQTPSSRAELRQSLDVCQVRGHVYFSREHVLFPMPLLRDDVVSVCVRFIRVCRRRSARSLQLFRS